MGSWRKSRFCLEVIKALGVKYVLLNNHCKRFYSHQSYPARGLIGTGLLTWLLAPRWVNPTRGSGGGKSCCWEKEGSVRPQVSGPPVVSRLPAILRTGGLTELDRPECPGQPAAGRDSDFNSGAGAGCGGARAEPLVRKPILLSLAGKKAG